MASILESCAPRTDLTGCNFNPEIFTANLMQVIDHYRGETDVVENIYTDPAAFFGECTYPTEGMRQVLRNVFGRLKGKDATFPAIQRLETAFGGGADGVELDEGDAGDVVLKVTHSRFIANGAYCAGIDLNNEKVDDPACVEVDDGKLVLDLDDGFDVDEAGDGSIVGRVTNVLVKDNLDEGLDFDEEGDGGFDLAIVKARTYGNGDEGVKLSEKDEGDVTASLRSVIATDNGDDGIQIEEEDSGDLTVRVKATTSSDNKKEGLKVSQGGDGVGTLWVRGSEIDSIDLEGVDEI